MIPDMNGVEFLRGDKIETHPGGRRRQTGRGARRRRPLRAVPHRLRRFVVIVHPSLQARSVHQMSRGLRRPVCAGGGDGDDIRRDFVFNPGRPDGPPGDHGRQQNQPGPDEAVRFHEPLHLGAQGNRALWIERQHIIQWSKHITGLRQIPLTSRQCPKETGRRLVGRSINGNACRNGSSNERVHV